MRGFKKCEDGFQEACDEFEEVIIGNVQEAKYAGLDEEEIEEIQRREKTVLMGIILHVKNWKRCLNI